MKRVCGLLATAQLLVAVLAGCGGGGGGGSGAGSPASGTTTPPGGSGDPPPGTNPPTGSAPGSISFSTKAINFQTKNRNTTPDPQTVNATISADVAGKLYVLINTPGQAILAINNLQIKSPTSGEMTVQPRLALDLSVGTHTDTITIIACVDDPTCATKRLTGTPYTIDVTYTIESAVQGDIAAPRIVVSGESGEVVLRGRGFTPATQVSFGAQQATEITIVSDTEIRAKYPPLTAGSYDVQVNGGSIQFAARIVAVDAFTHSAASLAYPGSPTAVASVVYDAARHALFVPAQYASNANNSILKYTYQAGSWSSAQQLTIPTLRDIAFSPDGSRLLALTESGITEVDPDALSTQTAHTLLNSSFYYLRQIAVANDGYALLNTGVRGSGASDRYLYSTTEHALYRIGLHNGISFGNSAASANGALVAVTESLITSDVVERYDASTQRYSRPALTFGDMSGEAARPALDLNGARLIYDGYQRTHVYDRDHSLLGTLPTTTRALTVNRGGTRAYTFDGSGNLQKFDLTTSVAGGAYAPVGASTPLSAGLQSGRAIAMTISPDGKTVFVAGSSSISVQPVTP